MGVDYYTLSEIHLIKKEFVKALKSVLLNCNVLFVFVSILFSLLLLINLFLISYR